MIGWRIGYGLGLIVFVAAPLVTPFNGLWQPETWVWTTDDGERLFQLALTTLALTGGTIALAVPVGVGLAAFLLRTSFPGRRSLLFLLALCLFVPLPVIVSSWQAILGSDGLGFWRGPSARVWATGLGPAIWIHAIAAVPWVAFIVGIGLTWVEPELEEEAAQSVGPWRVLALVTLPRTRASILAAALFVVLQTAGEVSVTEMMLVPTLAEEVRTQFAVADNALARALVLSLPMLLLTWAGVRGIISYLENYLPPPAPAFRVQPALALGPPWLRFAIAAGLLAVLVLPLLSLTWNLGLAGHPGRWSSTTAWHFLQMETRVLGKSLLATFVMSLLTGLLTAGLAVVGCWLARDSRWFRWLLFSVLMWVWVLPGPVIGMGLHDTIWLLPPGPWKQLLSHGPSPVPLMWVQAMRALPIAVVFLWPVVRVIPREWFEEARLGGAGAVSEFTHVVAPMTWRAALVTALAAAALCLGEVGASARVETPGWESFTKMLLDRMHTGVNNNVAALSMMMLTSLAALGLTAFALWKLVRVFSHR